MKEGIFIKPITQTEVDFLRNNNMKDYVICGHGTYHTRFVVESPKVLQALENYRQLITKN